MRKLAPSILSADFYKLGEEIENAIKTGADWIHVDVIDSHFAPPLTFGSKIVKDIKKHIKVFCDAHLMVTNPQDHIQQFIEAGTDLINFHSEVCFNCNKIIQIIKKYNRLVGITLNPITPVSSIKDYLPLVDLVLVMSVNPGYSGQKCMESNFEKIVELKKIREENNFKYLIQIDGGISIKNILKPIKAGVDVIVAGDGFFKTNMSDREKFVNIIHND